MIPKKMQFSPGPVMTSDKLKASLNHPDLNHRREDFMQIVASIRKLLISLFKANDEYTTVVVSGSGTAANETALSSLIKPGEEVLLIKNGMFGERLDEILSCYQYPLHRLEYIWGERPKVDEIEAKLKTNENIKWICIVFHETSTGMINPISEIGQLSQKYNRKFFVDCVSAVAGEDVNVVRDHIDACTSSSNKCVASIPGASFVCVRRSVVPKLGTEIPRRNVYLNLQKHIDAADKKNQTPNTSAVNAFVALDFALKELFEEGLENRIQRHKKCAKILHDGFTKLSLPILIPEPYRSNTATLVTLPLKVNNDEFLLELERKGFVINYAYEPLHSKNMVEIGNMGWIMPEDCVEFLKVFEKTLKDML